MCGAYSKPHTVDFAKATPRLHWDNEGTGGGSFMFGAKWRDRTYLTAAQLDRRALKDADVRAQRVATTLMSY